MRDTPHASTMLHIRNAEVMGNIEENRYRYNIDTLAKVSILRYPSKNPHYELHISDGQ